jgi:hypothetical protein
MQNLNPHQTRNALTTGLDFRWRITSIRCPPPSLTSFPSIKSWVLGRLRHSSPRQPGPRHATLTLRLPFSPLRVWLTAFLTIAKNATKSPPKLHHVPEHDSGAPAFTSRPASHSVDSVQKSDIPALDSRHLSLDSALQYDSQYATVRVRPSKSPMFTASSTGLRLQPPGRHPRPPGHAQTWVWTLPLFVTLLSFCSSPHCIGKLRSFRPGSALK